MAFYALQASEITIGPSDPWKSQTIPFFELPREIRDLVYHRILRRVRPCIRVALPGSDIVLEYRYEGHYQIAKQMGPNEDSQGMSRGLPISFLCGRQFYIEALDQFASKAEWFCDGYFNRLNKRNGADFHHYERIWPAALLSDMAVKTKVPGRMTLYGGNLAHHENPPRNQGDWFKDTIDLVTETLRKQQETGALLQIERLRVVGHIYEDRNPKIFTNPGDVINNLWRLFEGIDFSSFEVEIHDRHGTKRVVLYNVTRPEVGQDLNWKSLKDFQRRQV